MFRRNEDSGYSLRRMIFVFGTTLYCLIASTALVVFGYSGDLVLKLVTGMFDLISTIAILYMGVGTIDRSQILHRIGESFRRSTRVVEIDPSPRTPDPARAEPDEAAPPTPIK